MAIKTVNIISNLTVVLFSIAFLFWLPTHRVVVQAQATFSRPLHLSWFVETNNISNLTPAAGGGKIYIALDGGTIVSLNTSDGSFSWKSDIGGEVSAAPVADSRGIYVASEISPVPNSSYYQATGALRIMGKESGVILWMRTLSSPMRGKLASSGTAIFGCTSDGHLYAIKKETGEIIWVRNNPAGFNPSPILNGNNLYVSDVEGNISLIDQTTGRTLWRYRTRKSLRTPLTIMEDTIYSGSNDGSVYAINLSTRHLNWRVRTGAAIQALLPAGKCLLATSLDNFVYCLSPENGGKLWKRQLAGRVEAQPLVLGDSVLLSPITGDECVILDLQDGRKINSVFVGEDSNTGASPLFVENLLLLTTRKGLFAFSNQPEQPTDNLRGEPAPPSR
jgi:outer membrane protein assembly factor BamB